MTEFETLLVGTALLQRFAARRVKRISLNNTSHTDFQAVVGEDNVANGLVTPNSPEVHAFALGKVTACHRNVDL